MKKFCSLLILSALTLLGPGLPAWLTAGVIPAPEDILGFKAGADYHLINYQQATDYLKQLASVSNRIKLEQMGQTTLGLPMYYAIISSPENLARLQEYKDIIKKLSLGQAASPQEAWRLAAEGRAIVYIDGGLHATECAPAQHLVQLAYDLVSGEDERTKKF